jgi:hypothetical protein
VLKIYLLTELSDFLHVTYRLNVATKEKLVEAVQDPSIQEPSTKVALGITCRFHKKVKLSHYRPGWDLGVPGG